MTEGQPFGHYLLVEKLGEDSFTELWQARHQVRNTDAWIRIVRAYQACRQTDSPVHSLAHFERPNLPTVSVARVDVELPRIIHQRIAGIRL